MNTYKKYERLLKEFEEHIQKDLDDNFSLDNSELEKFIGKLELEERHLKHTQADIQELKAKKDKLIDKAIVLLDRNEDCECYVLQAYLTNKDLRISLFTPGFLMYQEEINSNTRQSELETLALNLSNDYITTYETLVKEHVKKSKGRDKYYHMTIQLLNCFQVVFKDTIDEIAKYTFIVKAHEAISNLRTPEEKLEKISEIINQS